MSNETIVCEGLDGADPLGMLATLGTLSIGARAGSVGRVAWERRGRWRPAFVTEGGRDALVHAIVEALVGVEAAAAREQLELLQTAAVEAEQAAEVADLSAGLQSSKADKRAAKAALKAAKERAGAAKAALKAHQNYTESLASAAVTERHPVTQAALHLDDVTKGGLNRERLRDLASHPAAASYLVGVGADLHIGRGKQTLARTHFSFANNNSGKQLLKDFARVASLVTPSRVRDALFGPGMLRDRITGLGWEPGSQRSYALQFFDPQDEVTCQVVHHALAFVGLGLLPVMPSGRDRATTGFSRFPEVSGESDSSDAEDDTDSMRGGLVDCWTWPLWQPALTESGTRTLLAWAGLAHGTPPVVEMRARGIAAVHRARRIVFDKRSYFSPARAVA